MIIIAGLIGGAVYGVMNARKRGGKTLDLIQYATVYAIAFGLLGLFITSILSRLL
jgi:UDP-N-acetylenolpyruvoylglucosamine reductase